MFGALRKYRKNETGQIAVITAIAAVPLMLGVSLAVDSQRAASVAANLQDALDSATLAAVTKGTLDRNAQSEHAKMVFLNNYTGNMDVDLKATATESRVSLSANASFPRLLGGMMGKDRIQIERSSTAELVKETVTCLLVLAPYREKALVFSGNSSFNSPDCAVQVNSTHHEALWGGSTISPIAKDFCVSGGYYGRFGTHVKTECRPIEDPYKDKILPDAGPCGRFSRVTQTQPVFAGLHMEREVFVEHTTQSRTTLFPGNYCGGIKLDGQVTLRPGVYHITDGPIIFGENADIQGDNVTFILRGKKARLDMHEGSKADITASRKGELGGIAFYQVPSDAVWPDTQSLIRSGGDLTVNGVFYFPKTILSVKGTANIGAKAKATAFIAHAMKIDADVNTTINVDHVAAGLPPLEPRTDEDARLVR